MCRYSMTSWCEITNRRQFLWLAEKGNPHIKRRPSIWRQPKCKTNLIYFSYLERESSSDEEEEVKKHHRSVSKQSDSNKNGDNDDDDDELEKFMSEINKQAEKEVKESEIKVWKAVIVYPIFIWFKKM